jgi:hypothetical protein
MTTLTLRSSLHGQHKRSSMYFRSFAIWLVATITLNAGPNDGVGLALRCGI